MIERESLELIHLLKHTHIFKSWVITEDMGYLKEDEQINAIVIVVIFFWSQ